MILEVQLSRGKKASESILKLHYIHFFRYNIHTNRTKDLLLMLPPQHQAKVQSGTFISETIATRITHCGFMLSNLCMLESPVLVVPTHIISYLKVSCSVNFADN